MIRKLQKFYPEILIFFLSLTPVIWFLRKPGFLINGTDTNFPLDPIAWWLARFHVFQDTINEGIDWPTATAGLFFHGIQALAFVLTKNLVITELLTCIFWFSLILFSMYYFLKIIIGEQHRIANLVGTIIYAFNIYLFNSWENIKVTNLALVGCLPFLLGFLHEGILNRKKRRYYLILTMILSFIASGSGINPAYFLVLLFIYGSFGLFVLVCNKKSFHRNFKTVILFVLFVLLTNAFWILPFLASVFGASGQQVTTLSDLSDLNWVDNLSKHTSIGAVIRMLGPWDWYELGKGDIPYVPYATVYFNNPFFITMSLLIPALCFSSVAFFKKKIPLFFLGLSLLGVILASGTHLPYGIVYTFATQKLPFFSFFRSPWYIFTPLVVIGYAVLIAHFLAGFSGKFGIKWANSLGLFLGISILIFNYPLITGDVFRPDKPVGQSLYVKVPDYVQNAMVYLKESPLNRVLSIPFDSTETFTWGYSGVGSILNLISNKDIIVPRFGIKEKAVIDFISLKLQQALNDLDTKKAVIFARISGVNGFFVKHDIQSPTAKIPQFPENSFKRTQINNWEFYNFRDSIPLLFISGQGIETVGSRERIPDVFDFITADPTVTFYANTVPDIFQKNRKEVIFVFPDCFDCLLNRENQTLDFPFVQTLPSSHFYYKTQEYEDTKADKIINLAERQKYYLASSLRITAEIEQMFILKQDEKFILAWLKRLPYEWQKIDQLISTRSNEKNQSRMYYDDLATTIQYGKKELSLLDGLLHSPVINKSIKEETFKSLSQLLAITSELKKQDWQSTVQVKRFSFTLPQQDLYRIMIKQKTDIAPFFAAPFSVSKLLIDNNKVDEKEDTLGVLSSVVNLENGFHTLSLYLPPLINIVTGTDQPENIELNNDVAVKNVIIPLKIFQPDEVYRLSFSYRTVQGEEPQIFISQDSDFKDLQGKPIYVLNEHLEKDSIWRYYQKDFKLNANTTKAALTFLVPALNNIQTTNQIKDLKVELLYQPEIAISNSPSFLNLPFSEVSMSLPLSPLPEITVNKNSPTKYTVTVKDATQPFPLIFLMKYSKAWKVWLDQPFHFVGEKNHFLVNEYGNGWIIDKKGTYKVTIEYWPEYLFYLGALLGGLGFISLIILSIRKRNENH